MCVCVCVCVCVCGLDGLNEMFVLKWTVPKLFIPLPHQFNLSFHSHLLSLLILSSQISLSILLTAAYSCSR